MAGRLAGWLTGRRLVLVGYYRIHDYNKFLELKLYLYLYFFFSGNSKFSVEKKFLVCLKRQWRSQGDWVGWGLNPIPWSADQHFLFVYYYSVGRAAPKSGLR